MSDFNSGQFVLYEDHGSPENGDLGLVLQTSVNEKEEGENDEFVEVVGPLPRRLLRKDQVRNFSSEPAPDPDKITGSSASDVGGVGQQPKSVSEAKGGRK